MQGSRHWFVAVNLMPRGWSLYRQWTRADRCFDLFVENVPSCVFFFSSSQNIFCSIGMGGDSGGRYIYIFLQSCFGHVVRVELRVELWGERHD